MRFIAVFDGHNGGWLKGIASFATSDHDRSLMCPLPIAFAVSADDIYLLIGVVILN